MKNTELIKFVKENKGRDFSHLSSNTTLFNEYNRLLKSVRLMEVSRDRFSKSLKCVNEPLAAAIYNVIEKELSLSGYDLIIINSSAGKDSLCAIWEICRMADEQKFARDKIIVSHQCLGESEWPETFELAKKQADLFGLDFKTSKRRNQSGYEESLLEYAERKGKWPSNKQRWCTSDFKRGPGARVVTAETKGLGECKVLYVFGFRKDESPSRLKKEVLKINKKLTTKKRTVHEYLPIHDWSTEKVWKVIRENDLPYHYAYDLGMPRLSCAFCIFAPFDALVIAGKANPQLLDKYVATEKKISHDFRQGMPIVSVKEAIDDGYEPKTITNWAM